MSIKKGIAYVFLATIVGFIINLLINFILPKFLPIESYADIKLYQLYITYVGILHFGFSDGMYLRLGGKNLKNIDKNEIASEFKTFKIFQLIINIIALFIAVLLNNVVLIAVSISILPINTINYLKSLYQSTGIYDSYSKFTITNNIMLFLINILLIFIIKTKNPVYYITGNVVVYFINWILIERNINRAAFKGSNAHIETKYLINNVKSGFPLMIGNLGTVIFTSIDRVFVKKLLGSIMFAYYSFAVSVEGLLNTFVTPITVTMYNYLCVNKNIEKTKRIKRLLLAGLSILISATFPIKWIVDNYITKYNKSLNVLFILFAAQFFTIIVRCIHINLYKAMKKQNRYFLIINIIMVLAIILDIIFYKIFHSNEGFAIATLITGIVWFIIGEFDFKSMRYSIKEYILMVLIIVIFLMSGLVIKNEIIAFLIYLLLIVIIDRALLKEDMSYLKEEIKNVILKIKNKYNK